MRGDLLLSPGEILYLGQQSTTVMARLSRPFVSETLWPEFQELQQSLAASFDVLTVRVIEQALEVGAGEDRERGEPAQLEPVDHQGSLLQEAAGGPAGGAAEGGGEPREPCLQ